MATSTSTSTSNNVWRSKFSRAKEMTSNILVGDNICSDPATFDLVANLHQHTLTSNHFMLTDDVVDELYGESIMTNLQEAGFSVTKLVIPTDETHGTETSKTVSEYTRLVDEILEEGITKHSIIFALGGGVVCNIAGHIAGTLYRGIPLVHIPTTAMGQVDAAIDFKQAINHELGKNLIGCFYPATYILIDPLYLQTQSDRAILNGLAECMKHGLVHDVSLVESIVNAVSTNNLRSPEFLRSMVIRTISLKVPTLNEYNSNDFNEMCPQYGHAIGHAVEYLSLHQDKYHITHGEAVSIGCCVTAEIAYLLGICDRKTVDDHYTVLQKSHLPTFVPANQSVDAVMDQLFFDKHFVNSTITVGMLTKLGHMYNEKGKHGFEIQPDIVASAIEANMAKRRKWEIETKMGKKNSVSVVADVSRGLTLHTSKL